jgi:hypothetical protein
MSAARVNMAMGTNGTRQQENNGQTERNEVKRYIRHKRKQNKVKEREETTEKQTQETNKNQHFN